ncbi:hypothetical protein [Enemella evansiae]|uniref:DedA family protein n=1 Tax=Enemella evansiae TaxID=2016499 RepID=A0A255GTE1_9ACTN|nr:hypothetical protein [Enemella evansiae]OYO17743.1 hypothetical protein CGZ94_02340 [Enemella evansiae]TDO89793.1 hypothetical protein C8D81_2677 [Enemella evansiae]
MIEFIQTQIAQLPAWLTWLGVLVASAIPFVESHFGAVLGVVLGFPLPLAILLAAAGNLLVVLAIIYLFAGIRERIVDRRGDGTGSARSERRYAKIRARLNRYGVPGVCLLGQGLVPNQISAAVLVSMGIARNRVAFWMTIAIIGWAVALGTLASLGINVLR